MTHRGGHPDRVPDVGTDRAVLVGAVDDLAGTERPQIPPGIARDAVTTLENRRLVLRQVAGVQEVGELLADHRRVHGIGP